MTWRALRAHSLKNIPNPVRTLVVQEISDLSEAILVDFGRICSILGDFSAGTLTPKHTSFPGSWIGTDHYLKSALVPISPLLPRPHRPLCSAARTPGCTALQVSIIHLNLSTFNTFEVSSGYFAQAFRHNTAQLELKHVTE
jgi:hypothetical protein